MEPIYLSTREKMLPKYCIILFPTKHDFVLGIELVTDVIVILPGCVKSYLRIDLLSISLRGSLPTREPICYWKVF